jgi:hypothetical protein
MDGPADLVDNGHSDINDGISTIHILPRATDETQCKYLHWPRGCKLWPQLHYMLSEYSTTYCRSTSSDIVISSLTQELASAWYFRIKLKGGTLGACHPPRLHKGAVVHDGSLVEAGGMTCAKGPSPNNQQAQLDLLTDSLCTFNQTSVHEVQG